MKLELSRQQRKESLQKEGKKSIYLYKCKRIREYVLKV